MAHPRPVGAVPHIAFGHRPANHGGRTMSTTISNPKLMDPMMTNPSQSTTPLQDELAAMPVTVAPFRRIVGGSVAELTEREWLVTNGLGGYASGTLSGAAT